MLLMHNEPSLLIYGTLLWNNGTKFKGLWKLLTLFFIIPFNKFHDCEMKRSERKPGKNEIIITRILGDLTDSFQWVANESFASHTWLLLFTTSPKKPLLRRKPNKKGPTEGECWEKATSVIELLNFNKFLKRKKRR